jgi:hypothetical protein
MITKSLNKYIFLSFVFIFSLLLFLPSNPQSFEPGQDSSVFLYTAKIISEGGVPYVDSWDHKGPFIYFLNLLAYKIPPNFLWGLFFLNCILLIISTVFLFHELSNYFSVFEMSIGYAIFLSSLSKILIINRTELYTAFFLMISVGLFLKAERLRKPAIYFIIGVLCSIVLLMRPNNAVFWAILFLMLMSDCYKKRMLTRQILFFIIGALVTFFGTMVYLWKIGAFPDFFEQFINYNFFYATASNNIISVFITIINNLKNGFGIPLVLLSVAAYYFSTLWVGNSKNESLEATPLRKLVIILLFAFPFEILSTGLASRTNVYYLSILPVYFMLFAVVMISVLVKNSEWLQPVSTIQQTVFLSCMLIVFSFATLRSFNILETFKTRIFTKEFYTSRNYSPDIQYIRDHTTADDTVLVWGAAVQNNVLSDRKSPSRFTYAFPLVQCGYATEKMWKEFNDDLVEAKPKLIIEIRNFPIPTDLVTNKYCTHISGELQRFLDFIGDNYGMDSYTSSNFLTVFSLNE